MAKWKVAARNNARMGRRRSVETKETTSAAPLEVATRAGAVQGVRAPGRSGSYKLGREIVGRPRERESPAA